MKYIDQTNRYTIQNVITTTTITSIRLLDEQINVLFRMSDQCTIQNVITHTTTNYHKHRKSPSFFEFSNNLLSTCETSLVVI